jgi:hypothetical protein
MKVALPFLLLGIAIGYFLPRATPGEETLSNQEKRQIRTGIRNQLERSVPARPIAEFEDLNDDEMEKKISDLSNEEVRAQIKAVLSEVDPFDGLTDGYFLLEALLKRLAIEDFHGNIAWLESSFPSTSQSLKIRIFEAFAQHNYDGAMTYAESLLGDKVTEKLFESLFRMSFTHENSAVEKAFMLMGTSEDGTSGGSVEFSDQFDFKSFADLLIQKGTSLG